MDAGGRDRAPNRDWRTHRSKRHRSAAGLQRYLELLSGGRAQAALAALKSKLAVTVTVKRDGAWREISAIELAPGDLVKLEIGGAVPADARIVEGSILLDQSTLTGESVVSPTHGGARRVAIRPSLKSGLIAADRQLHFRHGI